MIIDAVDAETTAPVRMNHPDAERDTKIRGSDGLLTRLWERHTDVYVGSNRFKHVFNSVSMKKLVWHYPKEKLWVVLHYDEEKEDTDAAYAAIVDELMARPASAFQVDTKKQVIDATDESKKRGARPKRKKVGDEDESFDAPFKVDVDMKTDEKDKVVVPTSMMKAASSANVSLYESDKSLKSQSAPLAAVWDTKTGTWVPPGSASADGSASAPADGSASAPADDSGSTPSDASGSAPADASGSAPAGASSSLALDAEKQKLEDALKLAQEELTKKTAELNSEIDRADNAERLHRNYKQREGRKDMKTHRENVLLKQENHKLLQEKSAFDAACQAERDAAQQKFEQQQKVLKALKAGSKDPTLKNVGASVDGAYSEIVQFVQLAYETKAKALSLSNISGAGASAAGASAAGASAADTFMFLDQSNNWVQITDALIINGLSMLSSSTDLFSYARVPLRAKELLAHQLVAPELVEVLGRPPLLEVLRRGLVRRGAVERLRRSLVLLAELGRRRARVARGEQRHGREGRGHARLGRVVVREVLGDWRVGREAGRRLLRHEARERLGVGAAGLAAGDAREEGEDGLALGARAGAVGHPALCGVWCHGTCLRWQRFYAAAVGRCARKPKAASQLQEWRSHVAVTRILMRTSRLSLASSARHSMASAALWLVNAC